MLATCIAMLLEVVEARPLGKAKAELPEGKRTVRRKVARFEWRRPSVSVVFDYCA